MADFTAKVDQELVVASAGRTLTAHGTVAFKRPGKMRWNLQSDETQIIVADGKTLWFYQPDEQQVLRSPFETAFRSSTPISFLTGVGRIRDDFEASIDGREEGEVTLALLPRRQGGEVGRLRLTVETANYDIIAAEIFDPLGNITRLRFSDLKRNGGLEDSLFEFEVPDGVDIIDAPTGY
jgi:outer membrane lipoprotein carrier protein